MAQCKLCKKKGLFLTVSDLGLCNQCHPMVVMDVQQRRRIVIESANIVDTSKNMRTRLSRWDIIKDHMEELLEYEQAGIRLGSPWPSEILRDYRSKRDKIVVEGVNTEVEKAMSKAEIATSIRTSVTAASKALLAIKEGKEELGDAEKLDELEDKVKKFIHKIQLNGYLEAAQKAEFKGQKKKALDQYQEALYLLRTDDIDDTLQQDHIQELEEKIKRLSE